MYSCGSVGREDDNRGPWFESRHRQNLKINIVTVNCWKDKNKEKEAKNGSFFKFFNDIKNDIFKSQLSACFISQVKSYLSDWRGIFSWQILYSNLKGQILIDSHVVYFHFSGMRTRLGFFRHIFKLDTDGFGKLH